jgi:hypothetical protein
LYFIIMTVDYMEGDPGDIYFGLPYNDPAQPSEPLAADPGERFGNFLKGIRAGLPEAVVASPDVDVSADYHAAEPDRP